MLVIPPTSDEVGGFGWIGVSASRHSGSDICLVYSRKIRSWGELAILVME